MPIRKSTTQFSQSFNFASSLRDRSFLRIYCNNNDNSLSPPSITHVRISKIPRNANDIVPHDILRYCWPPFIGQVSQIASKVEEVILQSFGSEVKNVVEQGFFRGRNIFVSSVLVSLKISISLFQNKNLASVCIICCLIFFFFYIPSYLIVLVYSSNVYS